MMLNADRYDEDYAAGWQLPFPVAASTTIYKGALVCVNLSGYLIPGADILGFRFVGIAREGANNSSGSDGDLEAVIVTQGSIVVGLNQKTVPADVGKPARCIDDETIEVMQDVGVPYPGVYCGLIVSVVDTSNVRLRFDAGDCAPK